MPRTLCKMCMGLVYQLALGQNPVLPAVLNDKSPALIPTPGSNIICANLNALYAARSTFIESEWSQRLCGALQNNIHTYSDTPILTGDKVYNKRLDVRCWRGLAMHCLRKEWAASAPNAWWLLYLSPLLSTEASTRFHLSCRITSCRPY